MKKTCCVLLFSVTLCATFCSADTWTSVKGGTLKGEFVSYDLNTETISIRRTYDYRIFSIPETELIHSDRIKAIRLHNKDITDYWYTDYEKARSENLTKQCFILYRNNAEPNAFERFYTKLLLQKYFVQLLESLDFVVCVTESVPDEFLAFGRQPDDNKTSPQRLPYSGRPLAIFTDFAAEPSLKGPTLQAIFSIEKSLILTDPHMDLPSEPQYLSFEVIDQRIRGFERQPRPLTK